jgi:hypothetical protein
MRNPYQISAGKPDETNWKAQSVHGRIILKLICGEREEV